MFARGETPGSANNLKAGAAQVDSIIDYYSVFDEWGRLEREPIEFIINWHYIQHHLPAQSHVLDNGAGPGKYSVELAKNGHTVTLSDITPKLVEIAKGKVSESGLLERFNGFHVLNATHLDGLADETYDASLMMGPLYHLQTEQERKAAVMELHRVTKKDGLIFAAFQSRMRMTINSLQFPEHWKPHDNMKSIMEFGETGIFNHMDQGRFTGAYYFNLDEIIPFMEEHGFETIELIGSSGIAGLLGKEQQQYWEQRGEYQQMMELLIQTAKNPSILGISSHLLYIGRKK